MKKLAVIFSLAALTLLGVSCAKKDDNNLLSYQLNAYGQCVDQNGSIVNQTYCSNGYQLNMNGQCVQVTTGQIVSTQYCSMNNNGFQYMNGVCVQTSTGQQYPAQYCQNSGLNNGFQYINGLCIQTTTGQQAPAQYCQNGGFNNGMNSCVGQYHNPMTGSPMYCGTNGYGANTCQGMTLISYSTGQQTYCQ